MSTETRDNKIAIDAKNGERFALTDNGKVVEIFGGCASKSAIAGNRNKITTNGIQPYTAVVGNGLKANIEGLAGAAAVAGEKLKATITSDHEKTISDDIKEVYAELKGNGFDSKAVREIIRLRKKEDHERQEEEAMVELYKNALGMR